MKMLDHEKFGYIQCIVHNSMQMYANAVIPKF